MQEPLSAEKLYRDLYDALRGDQFMLAVMAKNDEASQYMVMVNQLASRRRGYVLRKEHMDVFYAPVWDLENVVPCTVGDLEGVMAEQYGKLRLFSGTGLIAGVGFKRVVDTDIEQFYLLGRVAI
jgi:hypothetical protein